MKAVGIMCSATPVLESWGSLAGREGGGGVQGVEGAREGAW